MISTLHIKNIGIIEDLNIDFNKGLNVLTGETGAGKTLIIDSLQIISGGRFSKDIIRRGRNTQNHHLPKNSNVQEYMYSTAFEALIGYLYLTKQNTRLKEILDKI